MMDKRPGSHTGRKLKNVGPEDRDNNKARGGVVSRSTRGSTGLFSSQSTEVK